jgi:hypothetical protein
VTSGSVDGHTPGTYVVTYSVGDGYNTATATRTVTVADTTPPTLSRVKATPSLILIPNHRMVTVRLTYTATDLSGMPACSVGVASSEPLNGRWDGNTDVDYIVIDARTVRVRAERVLFGRGRVYTITVACRDASGNEAREAATVTVPSLWWLFWN